MDFLDRYRQAKKGERQRRQVNPILKRWLCEIKGEGICCGQKIQYFLKREHDTHISVPKIYEIPNISLGITPPLAKKKEEALSDIYE